LIFKVQKTKLLEKIVRKISISVALIIFLFVSLVSAQKAAIVLKNGKIWTGVESKPFVSAVAINGNKIIAVGNEKSLKKFVTKDTQTIDLSGKFVMAGMNDSHIHFLGSSLGLFQVDLNDAKSLAEAQAIILKFATENPNAPWITGTGWQYSIFPNARLPLKEDIDAVVKDRPVYLRAYDGHTAWANSRAIELAGVTEKTEFTGFGEIVRDAKGQPSGVFKEGAMGLISRNLPPVTRETNLEALKKGMERAKSLGITSIQNAHGSLGEVELYDELLRKGELTLRTSFAFSVSPKTTQSDIDKITEISKKYHSEMLRVKAIKIVVDGVIESYTAAMLAPYTNKPETSGTPSYTPEELNNIVAMADKAGLQVYIHAIGDKGVQMALDSFENAIKLNGRRDSRFRIEHIETIQTIDIQRFVKLGVIASMEPIHADPDTISVWSDAIGTDRTSRGFAWETLRKAGAKLIFSSDHPASISISPWRGVHNAVNRQTIEGNPPSGWHPEHRVSVETALQAYTINGAFASFEENVKGQIAVGMLADLVVLDKNPFAIPTTDIYKLNVEMTLFDGRIIYQFK
jgi:predicted amidohydrolase YtcJ